MCVRLHLMTCAGLLDLPGGQAGVTCRQCVGTVDGRQAAVGLGESVDVAAAAHQGVEELAAGAEGLIGDPLAEGCGGAQEADIAAVGDGEPGDGATGGVGSEGVLALVVTTSQQGALPPLGTLAVGTLALMGVRMPSWLSE